MNGAAINHDSEVWHYQARELPVDPVIGHCAAIRRSPIYPRRRKGKLICDCRIIERERSRKKTVSGDAMCSGQGAARQHCRESGRHKWHWPFENASVVPESAR
jgi:hypothetical protein